MVLKSILEFLSKIKTQFFHPNVDADENRRRPNINKDESYQQVQYKNAFQSFIQLKMIQKILSFLFIVYTFSMGIFMSLRNPTLKNYSLPKQHNHSYSFQAQDSMESTQQSYKDESDDHSFLLAVSFTFIFYLYSCYRKWYWNQFFSKIKSPESTISWLQKYQIPRMKKAWQTEKSFKEFSDQLLFINCYSQSLYDKNMVMKIHQKLPQQSKNLSHGQEMEQEENCKLLKSYFQQFGNCSLRKLTLSFAGVAFNKVTCRVYYFFMRKIPNYAQKFRQMLSFPEKYHLTQQQKNILRLQLQLFSFYSFFFYQLKNPQKKATIQKEVCNRNIDKQYIGKIHSINIINSVNYYFHEKTVSVINQLFCKTYTSTCLLISQQCVVISKGVIDKIKRQDKFQITFRDSNNNQILYYSSNYLKNLYIKQEFNLGVIFLQKPVPNFQEKAQFYNLKSWQQINGEKFTQPMAQQIYNWIEMQKKFFLAGKIQSFQSANVQKSILPQKCLCNIFTTQELKYQRLPPSVNNINQPVLKQYSINVDSKEQTLLKPIFEPQNRINQYNQPQIQSRQYPSLNKIENSHNAFIKQNNSSEQNSREYQNQLNYCFFQTVNRTMNKEDIAYFVGLIKFYWYDQKNNIKKTSQGTGFLISNNAFVTAKHNFYQKKTGQKCYNCSIQIKNHRNQIIQYHSKPSSQWYQSQKADVALVILQDQVTHFTNNVKFLQRQDIKKLTEGDVMLLAGFSHKYPRQNQRDQIKFLKSQFIRNQDGYCEYIAQTVKGFSGSPILYKTQENNYFVISMHLTKRQDPQQSRQCRGLLFTEEVLRQIYGWSSLVRLKQYCLVNCLRKFKESISHQILSMIKSELEQLQQNIRIINKQTNLQYFKQKHKFYILQNILSIDKDRLINVTNFYLKHYTVKQVYSFYRGLIKDIEKQLKKLKIYNNFRDEPENSSFSSSHSSLQFNKSQIYQKSYKSDQQDIQFDQLIRPNYQIHYFIEAEIEPLYLSFQKAECKRQVYEILQICSKIKNEILKNAQ